MSDRITSRAVIPMLTGAQMAEIDRIMLEEFGVESLQLMELAGYAVADFARMHLLAGDPTGRRVLALAGTGGNGGDALVTARLLAAWGAEPTVLLSCPAPAYQGTAGHHLAIARRIGLSIVEPAESEPVTLPAADLIIDGLLGFSLRGDPRGPTAELIEAANRHGAPVLAIDVPSGLDATTGHAGSPCIHADMTLTLALPKVGLAEGEGRAQAGDVWIADIGVAAQAYQRIGVSLDRPLFARSPYVRWEAIP